MHDAMRSLRKKRGKAKIKEYEYTEVMDKVTYLMWPSREVLVLALQLFGWYSEVNLAC